MNFGDNPEQKEESYSEEPEEFVEEVEYVDEDGNPIDPSELEDYEVLEEDEDISEEEPLEEEEDAEYEEVEYVDEEPEEFVEEKPLTSESLTINDSQLTNEESTEILQDIQDISGIPLEELHDQNQSIDLSKEQTQPTFEEHNSESVVEQPRDLIQETQQSNRISEPVLVEESEQVEEPVPVQSEETYEQPTTEQHIPETIVEPPQEQQNLTQEPINESIPVQQEITEDQIKEQETLEFQRKQEELIRTISTGTKPEEADLDIFIKNAQDAQQKMNETVQQSQVQQPITQQVEESEPVVVQPQEQINNYQSQVTEPVQTQPVEPVQPEPQQVEEPAPVQTQTSETEDSNESLLQKLSLAQNKPQGIQPEKTNEGDSISNPYIYRKGHPHLGQNFSMDTISNLTERIFNSDDAVNKLKPKKK